MKTILFAFALSAAVLAAGCSTFNRAAYQPQAVTNTGPVAITVTNTVTVTNQAPVVTQTPAGPVTNFVPILVTNTVPAWQTQIVTTVSTQWLEKPEITAAVQSGGAIVNTFAPGLGTLAATALLGLLGMVREWQNRRAKGQLTAAAAATAQGIETLREIIKSTPQGAAMDAAIRRWLIDHQIETGTLSLVADLVKEHVDNPAAKVDAVDILRSAAVRIVPGPTVVPAAPKAPPPA